MAVRSGLNGSYGGLIGVDVSFCCDYEDAVVRITHIKSMCALNAMTMLMYTFPDAWIYLLTLLVPAMLEIGIGTYYTGGRVKALRGGQSMSSLLKFVRRTLKRFNGRYNMKFFRVFKGLEQCR